MEDAKKDKAWPPSTEAYKDTIGDGDDDDDDITWGIGGNADLISFLTIARIP